MSKGDAIVGISINTARIVKWLVGLVVGIMVLAIPCAYFIVSFNYLVGSMMSEAEVTADAIEHVVISSDPEMWTFQQTKLQSYLSHRPSKWTLEMRRAVNVKKELVAERGDKLESPVIMRSAKLMDAGVVVGEIEIYRSLRPVLLRTGLAALIALMIGAGVFQALSVLPLRRLQMAEKALIAANDELEAKVLERTAKLDVLNEELIAEVAGRESRDKELRLLNRLYAVLSQVNQVMARADDRDMFLSQVCRIAIEHGGFKLAWIVWREKSGARQFSLAACAGEPDEYVNSMSGRYDESADFHDPIALAIQAKRRVVCNNLAVDQRLTPWGGGVAEAAGIRSAASFPIRRGGVICGVLTVCGGESSLFGEREVALLDEVVMDISFGLDRLDAKTQRLRAEQSLQENEEKYRALFDEAAEGIAVVDGDTGIVIDCNAALSTLLERDRSEIIGKPQRIIHPATRDASGDTPPTLLRRLGTGEFIEAMIATKSGETRTVEIRTNVFRLRGRKVIQGIFQDITKRRQMEQELVQTRKLESIGQLAAGIAHEINTPTQFVGDNIAFLKDAFGALLRLTRIHFKPSASTEVRGLIPPLSGQAERAFVEGDADYLFEEIPKAIDQSLEGIKRIAGIVLAMKEFSHPGDTIKAPADLNRAIETTATVTRGEWKHAADLRIEPDLSLPFIPCLLGDLNQVFLNLIVNAVHAIKATGVMERGTKGLIKISTSRDGDAVEIRFSDNGTGIEDRHRSRIFEPFFTTKPVGSGTGQGLAMAYQTITRKHGGTIRFETKAGKGTTFIIRLPLGAETPAPQAERQA